MSDGNSWADFRAFLKSHAAQAVGLVAACVLMLSVVGLQNVPTWDDSGKRLIGNTGWGQWDGRWGGEWVSRALNQGRPLVDIGLTTFVVAGLAIGAAALIVTWALVGRRANWVSFIVALAFALNPWVMHALGFRFDGPLMAISVLTAVSSIFFYRGRLDTAWSQSVAPEWVIFGGYFLSAFITANFYQQALGLILTLLMTKSLIDWLRGSESTHWIIKRLGLGIAGVAAGLAIYMVQLRLFSAGRPDIAFDPGNLPRNFARNLFHFIRVFLTEQPLSWLLFSGLVVALALYALLRQSRQGLLRSALVLPVYLILSVLASGGILLFAAGEHIAVHARFRFPLAMGIAMLALIATTVQLPSANLPGAELPSTEIPSAELSNAELRGGIKKAASSNSVIVPAGMRPIFSRCLIWITRIVLIAFAYLWLMVVFLFAQAQGEQQNALRMQTSIIFSDVLSLYRPGDDIVYEPNIFTNSIYWDRVAERFPIFASGSYVAPIDGHIDNIRDRIIEMAGLPHEVLWATQDRPGVCDLVPSDAIRGPRWATWRADEQTVCVTFPPVADILINTRLQQVIQINLRRVPFAATRMPNLERLRPEDVRVAIWPIRHPDDIQWLYPEALHDGIVTFRAEATLGEWEGDLMVAHFFISDRFVFQQIWSID